MKEFKFAQFAVRVAPLLAPIPSAWFIGRSIYFYMLFSWHLNVHVYVNVFIAAVAGLAIELLAISSVYLALSLNRWNNYGHVRKKDGWERAPFWLAAVVSGIYLLVATYLLVVLEAAPDLAPYSAVAFPALALVGALNLGLFQQHQDRLDRYGLTWTFRVAHTEETREKPAQNERIPAQKPSLTADERKILELYREQPDLTYQGLADSLGRSKSWVGQRVLAMKDAGVLHVDSAGLMRSKNGG